MTLETSWWVQRSFTTSGGIDLVCRIHPRSQVGYAIARNGYKSEELTELFVSMIDDLWSERKHLTIDQLLEVINEGSKNAVVLRKETENA